MEDQRLDVVTLRRLLESTLNEHEDRRYLGMSGISQCPLRLYRKMLDGRDRPGLASLCLFHEGYVHERDIVSRLQSAGMVIENCQRELVAPWDDRFRGHIDGEIAGELFEIKSVNDERFERVVTRGALSKHVDQVQLYMLYGSYPSAILIYKNRETGALRLERRCYDEPRARALEEKARAILLAVDRRNPPVCACGRCR